MPSRLYSSSKRSLLGTGLLVLLGVFSARGEQEPSPQPKNQNTTAVDFVRDVKPILATRCYSCHGEDEQEGELRLDRKADAFRGGEIGKAIVAKQPEKSLLLRYVTGDDPDGTIMPLEGTPLSKKQVATLRRWIEQGADWPANADAVPIEKRAADHWAFQPPHRPALPAVKNLNWVRNPIDRFVLAKLEDANIKPSPQVNRTTLLRRLHLDLTGLPPTPTEIDRFLNDQHPDAYKSVVDQLLASPHFGERWSRYWLDLARYADTDGYEDDKYRPDAWRFRDWVIRAYNNDLPYDRFTVEQLAGDLLPDATYDSKVATGFHRMTLTNGAGGGGITEEFRVKTAKDRAATTGTVWLGLSLRCAECHSHKYDPIPIRDYYRFYAFFDNAEETNVPAPSLPTRYHVAYRKAKQTFESGQKRAKAKLAAFERNVFPHRFERWWQTADPADLPERIASIIKKPDLTKAQFTRLQDYFRSTDPESIRLNSAVLDGGEITNNAPLAPSSKSLTISSRFKPRQSYIHKRGNFESPGQHVTPGTPGFLPPSKPRGRFADRLDMARWIVDPAHPLTARVAVNRFWKHLFGSGLVITSDGFGTRGEKPSHPELLNWLAFEFVEQGWSRKAIIRLIVTSAAYQQSSRYREELGDIDADNRLLSRQNRYRVESEVVRDLALAASGLLEPAIGGPSIQPPLPTALTSIRALKNERFMEASTGRDRYRRGLYVNVQRTLRYPMLKTFDGADPNVVCTQRERSNTPLQALTLLNDPVFFECAQALGRRLAAESKMNNAARIQLAFRLCVGRNPDDFEHRAVSDLLAEQKRLATNPENAEATAWIGVARTLLNLDEFITRE